jgi:hypothetical protein
MIVEATMIKMLLWRCTPCRTRPLTQLQLAAANRVKSRR